MTRHGLPAHHSATTVPQRAPALTPRTPAGQVRWSRRAPMHRSHAENRIIKRPLGAGRRLQAGRYPPVDLQRNPKTP